MNPYSRLTVIDIEVVGSERKLSYTDRSCALILDVNIRDNRILPPTDRPSTFQAAVAASVEAGVGTRGAVAEVAVTAGLNTCVTSASS